MAIAKSTEAQRKTDKPETKKPSAAQKTTRKKSASKRGTKIESTATAAETEGLEASEKTTARSSHKGRGSASSATRAKTASRQGETIAPADGKAPEGVAAGQTPARSSSRRKTASDGAPAKPRTRAKTKKSVATTAAAPEAPIVPSAQARLEAAEPKQSVEHVKPSVAKDTNETGVSGEKSGAETAVARSVTAAPESPANREGALSKVPASLAGDSAARTPSRRKRGGRRRNGRSGSSAAKDVASAADSGAQPAGVERRPVEQRPGQTPYPALEEDDERGWGDDAQDTAVVEPLGGVDPLVISHDPFADSRQSITPARGEESRPRIEAESDAKATEKPMSGGPRLDRDAAEGAEGTEKSKRGRNRRRRRRGGRDRDWDEDGRRMGPDAVDRKPAPPPPVAYQPPPPPPPPAPAIVDVFDPDAPFGVGVIESVAFEAPAAEVPPVHARRIEPPDEQRGIAAAGPVRSAESNRHPSPPAVETEMTEAVYDERPVEELEPAQRHPQEHTARPGDQESHPGKKRSRRRRRNRNRSADHDEAKDGRGVAPVERHAPAPVAEPRPPKERREDRAGDRRPQPQPQPQPQRQPLPRHEDLDHPLSELEDVDIIERDEERLLPEDGAEPPFEAEQDWGAETPVPKGGKASREMLINASLNDECRIAILLEGRLEELYIERQSNGSHVGNIYKGKVTNVEPSIQAAFIDFGLAKNGFLHATDLQPRYWPSGKNGNEDVGRKVPRRDRPPIQQCLRRGQEVIVQVQKEGIGTKGPTLTTYLSIPGRYLVMMPGMNRLGVSRKIEDDEQRRAMKDVLNTLELPGGKGFILRTAGLGRTKRELQSDLHYLSRLWKVIEDRIRSQPAPCELYQESDLVIRTLRDVYGSDFARIVVDDEATAAKAKEFLAVAMPRTPFKLELYTGKLPLFYKHGIEEEIDKINSRRVPLSGGGSLVIESTEAMVAIDVNSGKFRDLDDPEATAFHINLEAAREIARQLQLRDLGGLIVCDFIDMRMEKHKRSVEKELREALKDHKERAKILRTSQFGLIEMTRQRQRQSIKRSLFEDCPHCEGTGHCKTAETTALDMMRLLQVAVHRDQLSQINIHVSKQVAFYLLNKKRTAIVALERSTNKTIVIHSEEGYTTDQYAFECFDSQGRTIKFS